MENKIVRFKEHHFTVCFFYFFYILTFRKAKQEARSHLHGIVLVICDGAAMRHVQLIIRS